MPSGGHATHPSTREENSSVSRNDHHVPSATRITTGTQIDLSKMDTRERW